MTVVTQTLVDRFDPALVQPTKPIGHALTEAEAERAEGGGTRGGSGRRRRLAPDDHEPDCRSP